MIKAILFDLDDTLIGTGIDTFFPAYLKLLGEIGAEIASPQVFVETIMSTFERSLQTYDPTRSLDERFIDDFSQELDLPIALLSDFFEQLMNAR